MALMTKLQRKYIQDIEKNLGITYTGKNNRTEASMFITQHKEENRKVNKAKKKSTPPTGKQLRLIKDIEKTFKATFRGKTLKSAKKFIETYYDDFRLNQTYDSKVKNYLNKKASSIDRKQRQRRR